MRRHHSVPTSTAKSVVLKLFSFLSDDRQSDAKSADYWSPAEGFTKHTTKCAKELEVDVLSFDPFKALRRKTNLPFKSSFTTIMQSSNGV